MQSNKRCILSHIFSRRKAGIFPLEKENLLPRPRYETIEQNDRTYLERTALMNTTLVCF